jgi:hypothetical protein
MDSNERLRLKMVVNTVARHAGEDGSIYQEEISLSCVHSEKEGSANKQWSKWTPTGNLKFSVTNPSAFGKLLPGHFIYVDLSQTDKDSL